MKNRTLIKLIFLFTILSSCSSKAQDTIVLSGTVDYHFHLSSTHKADAKMKDEIEKALPLYEKHRDEILNYILAYNKGEIKKARKHLKAKEINKLSDFELNYYFAILRMKELGVLYKPSIQVVDIETYSDSTKTIIISCTSDQFEKIKDQSKTYDIECVYLGELYIDNAKYYKLIESNEHVR